MSTVESPASGNPPRLRADDPTTRRDDAQAPTSKLTGAKARGRKGGETTRARYGPDHFRRLSQLGRAKTASRAEAIYAGMELREERRLPKRILEIRIQAARLIKAEDPTAELHYARFERLVRILTGSPIRGEAS